MFVQREIACTPVGSCSVSATSARIEVPMTVQNFADLVLFLLREFL